MPRTLQIGICTSPPGAERAARLRDAGCDYYEPSVAGAIMAAAPAEFDAAAVASWSAGDLPPRSANVFLPATLKIVGEEVDEAAFASYVHEAMRRAAALGLERVVFGSGDARRVPEGFSPEAARGQLADALRLAAGAAPDGTLVCLEHLRRAETNIVNSLAEAGELAEELHLERLALVVDAYHLQEEDEDPAVVGRFPDLVAHVHVCGPARTPPSAADEERLGRVFAELAAIGYEGRCSIECNWDDLDEQAPAALRAVRAAAERGGLA